MAGESSAPEAGATSKSEGFAFWLPLIAVSLAQFSVVLDSTMMNVAVGAIARDLGTNVTGVQGAISLYSLVMAALMLTGGKLGALRGGARIFMVGCAIFGAGSLLAAFSPNLGILILGWSVIEGIGAALILPMVMVLIFANYRGAQRAAAFGIFGAVQASGAALGPMLGGFLTSFLTWRLGFGMHVVIMAVALLLARSIKETERDPDTQLDLVGTALSAAGLATIVLGVLLAGRYGFFSARRPFMIGDVTINPFGLSPTPILIAIGAIVLVGFIHWERRLVSTGRSPLLRPRILRNAPFMASAATDTVRQLALAGVLFVVPVFTLSTLGFSAMESGLAILPFSAAVFVLSMTTSGLASRVAPKWLVLGGLAVFAVGLFVLQLVLSAEMEIVDFIVPMLIMGVGVGLFVAQIVNLTISQVSDDERSEGAGAHNTFRELGSSLGTAVIGAVMVAAVFTNLTDAALRAENLEASPQERDALAVELEDAAGKVSPEDGETWVASLPADEKAGLVESVATAQVDAMATALSWAIGFVILGLLVGTFLPGRSKRDEGMEPGIRAELK